jgi:hypothetical protein
MGVAGRVRARLWSTTTAFGLVARLDDLPEPRPAEIPVAMAPIAAFEGFSDEAASADGEDALEAERRDALCRAGVTTLYVAATEDGPAYAQWLVLPHEQAALHAHLPLFPRLADGEALVEGAYTFLRARGRGVMADGMHQLLVRAQEAGAERALTYVSLDNVPSLRGCARVGFRPDHLRTDARRLGRRIVKRAPLDAAGRAAWERAVG